MSWSSLCIYTWKSFSQQTSVKWTISLFPNLSSVSCLKCKGQLSYSLIPLIYSDQTASPQLQEQTHCHITQDSYYFVSKSLLRLSRKGNSLACITWQSKDTTNLKPGYWSKDYHQNLTSFFPSFGSFNLLASSRFTFYSQQLQGSKHASFSIELTLLPADRKMRPSLHYHCCQRDGLLD